jgi:hypothetical protein
MAGKSIKARANERTSSSIRLDSINLKDRWFVVFIDNQGIHLLEDNEQTAGTIVKRMLPEYPENVIAREMSSKGVWILQSKVIEEQPLFYLDKKPQFHASLFCYRDTPESDLIQLPFSHAISLISNLKVVRGNEPKIDMVLQ